MADFHQSGLVPTLHNLRCDVAPPPESDLRTLAKARPAGLVLPALYSEFESPAMGAILEELRRVTWLRRLVLVLSRANVDQYSYVRSLFSRFPTEATVLWVESEPVDEFLRMVNDAGLPAPALGKGSACWLGTGYLLAKGDCQVIAFQDCDIKTYHHRMLARLVYPLCCPEMNFEFAKAYYPRYTNQLNGRVARLFLTPLVRTMQDAGIHCRFLRFLDSFRYALSGEIAMTSQLAHTLRISPDWGLEISTLAEVYQRVPNPRICQVDLADCYDHKHQRLSPADPGQGLNRMSREIAGALFRAVASDGAVLVDELLRATLPLTYQRAAEEMIDRYAADAQFNGLEYDRAAEEAAVEVFAESLADAGCEFAAEPRGTPLLPGWRRVEQTIPGVFSRLIEAAEQPAELVAYGATA